MIEVHEFPFVPSGGIAVLGASKHSVVIGDDRGWVYVCTRQSYEHLKYPRLDVVEFPAYVPTVAVFDEGGNVVKEPMEEVAWENGWEKEKVWCCFVGGRWYRVKRDTGAPSYAGRARGSRRDVARGEEVSGGF